MKEVSEQLIVFLQSHEAITDIFGIAVNCRIYPVVAKEDTKFPFMTYTVGSVPYSQDGRQYVGELMLYHDKSYTALADAVDAVEAALTGSGLYDVAEIDTGFSNEYRVYVSNINFKIT